MMHDAASVAVREKARGPSLPTAALRGLASVAALIVALCLVTCPTEITEQSMASHRSREHGDAIHKGQVSDECERSPRSQSSTRPACGCGANCHDAAITSSSVTPTLRIQAQRSHGRTAEQREASESTEPALATGGRGFTSRCRSLAVSDRLDVAAMEALG